MPRGMPEVIAKKQKFYRVANFPNVIGLIDGSHIPIAAPSLNEDIYVNRKNFHSLNIQAVCDANQIFLDFCNRYPGSTHDSFVWHNCRLYRRFQAGEFGGAHLLGDSGYPLEENLMTPIMQPGNRNQVNYNNSHKRTRVIVEQTFGLWKSRFRCLHKSGGNLCYTPQKCGKIVSATMLLHNYCVRRRIPLIGEDHGDEDPNNEDDPDDPDPQHEGIRNVPAARAKRQRIVQDYF
ncbi:hypothetical protein Pmani_010241 [Petrolisthes manimaculis]|uniref:Putative nuclease HARBI1 n=1 Tax=Petrolisthes manimaculis TaxID=1843537 RepID=A0AAE1Q2L2_9EUCA|nr:hypothetical protein Pmani_010241 [Petrolisthes manimaculis]